MKIYTTPDGFKIPANRVPVIDRKKDTIAHRYLNKAKSLNTKIAEFKTKMLKDIDAIYAEMLKEANLEPTDRKGNFMLYSFDKSIKIMVKVSDRIEFDDHITIAQEKIKEFLNKKTEGADQDLAELVNNAFTTTKGRLDTKRILGLFNLKIKHKLWLEAIELIKTSITRNQSKRYVTVYERNGEGEYKAIPVNLAAV